MAFIITHSALEDGNEDFGTKLEKLEKPRVFGICRGERTHFKLYDDDANCYYTGYFFGDADSEDAFEPLDWATNDAGCTYIKYRQADGTYETL